MVKQFLIVIVALIALNSFGQQGTASPYSYYGIGELKFRGTVENKSMQSVSIYADSIHLNLQNPAALSKLRLTTFSVGGNQGFTGFKSDNADASGATSSIDYIAVGFPVGKKAGVAFGVLPYTSVGYKTGFIDPFAAATGDTRFEGSGGLNRVFLSGGYSITDELSFGVDANFNFGKIENVGYLKTGVTYDTKETNVSEITGMAVSFGLNYIKPLSGKKELFAGLTYRPSTQLISRNTRETATIRWVNVERHLVHTTITQDLGALKESRFKLPSQFTAGVGLSEPKKWFIGADFKMLATSELTNRTFSVPNVKFENSSQMSVGGFYIPRYNSLTNFWSRVVYRGGLRYGNTGLVVNNEKITEFGMSFGVGLPIARRFSNINIGLEYGMRGKTTAGLVKENIFNISLGFSFNEKWFVKRKIN